MAATGTTPIRLAHSPGPPSSSTSSAAAAPERMSFHSNASRTTSPAPSRHTMPCCWAPTDTAATSSRPPAAVVLDCSASHHSRGSTSVPSGCGDDADRTISPVSASQTTTLQDWVAKYVVSSTMTDPKWENSTVLAGDAIEAASALKSQPGKDIVVTGSIRLAHALIAGGVVDEYRLFVYPTVQGRGRRLFPNGTAIRRLTLVEAPKSFRSGITLLRYSA